MPFVPDVRPGLLILAPPGSTPGRGTCQRSSHALAAENFCQQQHSPTPQNEDARPTAVSVARSTSGYGLQTIETKWQYLECGIYTRCAQRTFRRNGTSKAGAAASATRIYYFRHRQSTMTISAARVFLAAGDACED